jgi:uncharacterized protein YndB with AHSA1/START domain
MTQHDERRTTDHDAPPATLTHEFELDHPPGKVWAAVTEPRLLARWLLPCDVEAPDVRLGLGAAFALTMPAGEGGEGRIDCEVVAAEPERRLVLTWRTHRDRDPRPAEAVDALVTFEVDALPRGRTLLRIRQRELPAVACLATARDRRSAGPLRMAA